MGRMINTLARTISALHNRQDYGNESGFVVPAPWWNMRKFQARFEDPTVIEEYEYELEGYGLRYEIEEFLRLIRAGTSMSDRLTETEGVFMAKVLGEFRGAE